MPTKSMSKVASPTTLLSLAVAMEPAPAMSNDSTFSFPPNHRHQTFAVNKTKNRRLHTTLIAAAITILFSVTVSQQAYLMKKYPSVSKFDDEKVGVDEKVDENADHYQIPPTLDPTKYEKILKAQEVLAYIMTKLHEIDAPIILMYGTMLHEFRNGTHGPYVSLNFQDKDFDIAVFPEHYRYIISWEDEIQVKFGWKVNYNQNMKKRLFCTISSPPWGSYSIDVYGFHCDKNNDLIYFPWDMVSIAKNSFLPLRKHKYVALREDITGKQENGNKSNPVFYIPHDPPCLMNNIYGPDYMTPKSGRSTQAKWGTVHGRPAHGNPECNSSLTTSEQEDLQRQLAFC